MIELALYHPEHGFYAAGGHAGRRGDFMTSAEVGPLFGRLVAEAIDREWERCGRPERFTVVDAGAGPGTLARGVLAAPLRCRDALDYLAVERAAVQRSLHPDGVRSVADLPDGAVVGVILANELLDNLPFTPVRRIDGVLHRLAVGQVGDDLVEVVGEALTPDEQRFLDEDIDEGVEQIAAGRWVARALGLLERGRCIVIDYARTRGADVRVRSYAQHERGAEPLVALGSQDITVDVDLPQLERRVGPAQHRSAQAAWLAALGLEALVEEGRAQWAAGAATGDLEALRGRSRIREAEALTDPGGLGAFTVAEWVKN